MVLPSLGNYDSQKFTSQDTKPLVSSTKMGPKSPKASGWIVHIPLFFALAKSQPSTQMILDAEKPCVSLGL